MDWSQISLGAVGGFVGARFFDFLKSLLDHFLDERKQRAAEDRTIRAEQREEERKENERKRVEAAQLKKDGDTLESFKTQVRGATDLVAAAIFVGLIHDFFIK